ncbi:DNA-protecting protein DprA [Massilia arenosa]|uniref:DNA-protecting protein DprA n=1 Tax=Zemynaea arenosa TaxID=2561931 RepID=A0A4Y9S7Z4_9BURK|nr:DNA-processing protein DprA [Massilia arenosa]TFW16203.1 DNA-protecting protein DprA [Massilia arenosa]
MQDTDPNIVDTPGADLALWLRLAETPGVGALTLQRLLERFDTPERILSASYAELRPVVTQERAARALLEPLPSEAERAVEQALAWHGQPGQQVLTLADPAYPAVLKQIPDPPAVLYARGDAARLNARDCLAIVGSRNASVQGVRTAQAFAQALSECGVTIVSGLALGIDAAAHAGALQGLGSTIAVVGTGVDVVYPARNRGLAHLIAEQGCIVSEFRLGTRVDSSNFPRRNRIISGMSKAVLVVEAAAQSGSLITARMAADQGRDVLAIPGSIHAALSKGCHRLIKQGAKLVDCAADVLEELHRPGAVPNAPQMFQHAQTHNQLLELLDGAASNAYDIALHTGLDPAFVNTQLLSLELEGLIERLPGGIFRTVRLGA